jgi:hypothetical protein
LKYVIEAKSSVTIQYKGGRPPGPLGSGPGAWGGRVPGPLGTRVPDPLEFKQIDLSSVATKATAKTFAMPAPTTLGRDILLARAVDWDLSKTSPLTEDIKQGNLGTCPIGSILGALANTPTGKNRINSLITEYAHAAVKTTFSKDVLDNLTARIQSDPDPDYRPPAKEVPSKRYFSVKLDSTIEVSDVFYVRYTDGSDADMFYMGSPREALWPCVIEKAFAAQIGSYDDLDDEEKYKANYYWGVLVGAPPNVLIIDDKTDLSKISAIASAATRVPAIGASKVDANLVYPDHGLSILGLQGSKIYLYDPHGSKATVTVEQFRQNFKAILSGRA